MCKKTNKQKGIDEFRLDRSRRIIDKRWVLKLVP